MSIHISKSGTLVVWSDLDFERLTWTQAEKALIRTEEIVGRIYRRFIVDGAVTIRLYALEDGNNDVITNREADINDPLYLYPLRSLPSPFNKHPMFTHLFDENLDIVYKEKTHTVTVHYSVASEETIVESGSLERGKTRYGKHAANNIGISVLRAGREIMLDQGWCIGYDPRERWWGAEVEFPPELDEVFGVTNNKQTATHFAELAKTEMNELVEEGEEFIDVVARLKEDGDPRGWLLSLSDSIKRNLVILREQVKAQGAGKRSSRRKRHDDPDDATKTVNKKWKDRSKGHPLEEDEKIPTDIDYNNIRTDLTENKNYSESEAEDLVALIMDSDLKVVFLESDFPDSFQLFNVEMKGNITEIIFNRKHPAFDYIFGTIAIEDEEVKELSEGEVIEHLTKAINATKIIFAAWARYEREAGIDRAKSLRKSAF